MQNLPTECLYHILEFVNHRYEDTSGNDSCFAFESLRDDPTDIRAITLANKFLHDMLRTESLCDDTFRNTSVKLRKWTSNLKRLRKCVNYWTIDTIWIDRSQLDWLRDPWAQNLLWCRINGTTERKFITEATAKHSFCNKPLKLCSLESLLYLALFCRSVIFCLKRVPFPTLYPKLQDLSILGARCVALDTIAMCANLESLVIVNSAIEWNVESHQMLWKLRSLHIRFCIVKSRGLLKWFSHSPTLTYLALESIALLVPECYIMDFSVPPLETLSITSIDFPFLITGLPSSLITLTLPEHGSRWPRHVDVGFIRGMCPNLKSIHFE